MSQTLLANAQGLALTLRAAYDLMYQDYWPGAPMQMFQHGTTFMRLFKPRSEVITVLSKEFKVIRGGSDSARMHRSPLRDWQRGNRFATGKVRLNYDEEVASNNDYCTVDGSTPPIPYTDLLRGSDPAAAAVNIAETTTKLLQTDFEQTFPIANYAGSTARLALVNGTPKNSDNYNFTDATTYTSGSTSARVRIDSGSIAQFKPNSLLDFYSSAGVLHADSVKVVTINPFDSSMWVALTADSTVANLNSVADDDEIFRSGERNLGMKSSYANWMSEPSSSDAFIGGSNRSQEAYAWLTPHLARTDATADEPISQLILDDAVESIDMIREPGSPDAIGSVVFMGHTGHVSTLRNDIAEAAIVNDAPTNRGDYTFGAKSVKYLHPSVGIVDLLGDPLHPLDKVEIITPENWELCNYLNSGPYTPPRGDMGGFYWLPGQSSNAGLSKYLQMDTTQTFALMCMVPSAQMSIFRVTR